MRSRPKTESAVWTVRQAAALLEVPEQRVRGLIEEGKLHAINVGTPARAHWRVLKTSLERFIKRRTDCPPGGKS